MSSWSLPDVITFLRCYLTSEITRENKVKVK